MPQAEFPVALWGYRFQCVFSYGGAHGFQAVVVTIILCICWLIKKLQHVYTQVNFQFPCLYFRFYHYVAYSVKRLENFQAKYVS